MFETVLLMALLVAAIPAAADDRPDGERIANRWVVVSFTQRGEVTERFRGDTVVFVDGLMTYKGKRGSGSGMYIIRPEHDPKQFDLNMKKDGKVRTARGMYKFEGANLIICHAPFDQPRAIKFDSNAENGNVLVVLEPWVPGQE